MFKNMIQFKNKLSSTKTLFTRTAPKRMFSNYSQQPRPSYAGMLGVGLGTAGLMYLMYHSHRMRQQAMLNNYGMQ